MNSRRLKNLRLSLLILLAQAPGAQAQFVITDQESKQEVLFLPMHHQAPQGLTSLGKVRSRGSAGFDYNYQLEKLAKKAIRKKANVLLVTDFYFEPGRMTRECGIEADMYASGNFDSLKRAYVRESTFPIPAHSPVVFYRPAFEDKFTKDYKYTLKVDSVKLNMSPYSIYTLNLRNDSTYFIKVPDRGILKLKVGPNTVTYVRCSTYFDDRTPPPPVFGGGISVNLFIPGKGTLFPSVELMTNTYMAELELSSMKNLTP